MVLSEITTSWERALVLQRHIGRCRSTAMIVAPPCLGLPLSPPARPVEVEAPLLGRQGHHQQEPPHLRHRQGNQVALSLFRRRSRPGSELPPRRHGPGG